MLAVPSRITRVSLRCGLCGTGVQAIWRFCPRCGIAIELPEEAQTNSQDNDQDR